MRTAGPGVNTAQLESQLGKLGDAWNELKSRVAEREQTLDNALRGQRNYQDTLANLLSWLEETEDLVYSQRAPSSDFKVVKAQLQEQKLLQKLIDDKKPSIEAFQQMTDRMQQLSDDSERHQTQDQLVQIEQRYESLTSTVRDRKDQLKEALDLAVQWSEHLQPFQSWLETAEKRLQKLDVIPTEEHKLQAQIDDHKVCSMSA